MMLVGFWGVLIDYRNDARDHTFIGGGWSVQRENTEFTHNLTPQYYLSPPKGR
jgi:hypothetical protein